MQVKEELSLSAKDFYDYLIHSILLDVFQNEERVVDEVLIKKGFSYQKFIRKDIPVDVEVLEAVRNKSYKAMIQYKASENTVSYDIEKTDQGIEVTYEEDYHSEKKLEYWNFKLLSFLLARRNKRKMRRMLRAMENYIRMKCDE